MTRTFPGWAGPFCWRCVFCDAGYDLFLRTVGTAAVNPWIKTHKFSMSFSTRLHLSLLFAGVADTQGQLTLVRRAD